MTLASKLVELARAEVGVTEVNGTNRGPRVDQYKAATDLAPHDSWPWCAAFICFLVLEAFKDCGPAGRYTFKRPTTASAFELEDWSRAQDGSTQTKRAPGRDIKAGDIVIFKFSHVGLAISAPDANGFVRTIEGNTDVAGSREGGGVFEKTRSLALIKTRIRFTV